MELPDFSTIQGHHKIGQGYNVLQDSFKSLSIFERLDSVPQNGYMVPEGFDIETLTNGKTEYFRIETKKDLAMFRLTSLGLESMVDSRLIPAFVGKLGSGIWEEDKAVHVHSYQWRCFRVSLVDRDQLTLSAGFEADVKHSSFPRRYSGTEVEKTFFTSFFEKWGSHFVRSAVVGGMLELSSMSKKSTEQGSDFEKVETELLLAYGKIYQLGSREAPVTSEESTAEAAFGSFRLRLIGGDSKFKFTTVGDASSENFHNWTKSLHSHAAVLEAGMRLISIHKVIEMISSTKAEACKMAANDLYGIMVVEKGPKLKKVGEAKPPVRPVKPAYPVVSKPPMNREEAAVTAEVNSGGCFPGTSTVQIRNRSEAVLMSDLRVGDQVLCFDVANNEAVFSEVFIMAHNNPDAKAQFLKVTG